MAAAFEASVESVVREVSAEAPRTRDAASAMSEASRLTQSKSSSMITAIQRASADAQSVATSTEEFGADRRYRPAGNVFDGDR